MGIGLVLVVPAARALGVISHLGRWKFRAWVIGEIIKGKGVVVQ
jgi:phosphoribosylaminoimidazole (AIR) synthetase